MAFRGANLSLFLEFLTPGNTGFPPSQGHHPGPYLPIPSSIAGVELAFVREGSRKFPEAASTGQECGKRLENGDGGTTQPRPHHRVRHAGAWLKANQGWQGTRLDGLEVSLPNPSL